MADSKPQVLIVDDQRSMRLTLSGIIEDQGYDVFEVEDGYEAIEAASKNTFDLVFMDIQMPGINGVQTFREIKKISPDILVIMMTGFAVEDLVKEALDEGAFSVVYKPFEDIEKVIDLIDSLLNPMLILVVDDRVSDRDILSQILTDKGYRVAGAADGDEAIQMVQGNQYNIIFMDIKLPGKDGFATFQEIKAINPDAGVIFMTGFIMEDSLRGALVAGGYPIAYKPFDIESVLAMVELIAAEKVK